MAKKDRLVTQVQRLVEFRRLVGDKISTDVVDALVSAGPGVMGIFAKEGEAISLALVMISNVPGKRAVKEAPREAFKQLRRVRSRRGTGWTDKTFFLKGQEFRRKSLKRSSGQPASMGPKHPELRIKGIDCSL